MSTIEEEVCTGMNTIDAVYKRRAVKHFDSTHRLTAAEERKLLEATIQAPTSFNIQAQMTDASLLILFTADVKAWQKNPERYWANAPKEVAELLVNWMGPFHEGREWLQRDEAQRSIGIAMQTMMLVAQDMGYQSCPMIGFDIAKVAELIKLPEDHVMGPMVAIGKGIKDPWPKPGQLPLQELVFEDTF